MRAGILSKSVILCMVPLQSFAEMSYSEYSLLIDDSKIIGSHIAALDACKKVLEESSLLRIQIPIQAMLESVEYDADSSGEMIRSQVITSLESAETDFELISKIDSALVESRELQFSEWYRSVAQLSSFEAHEIDETAIETSGSFCLNIMHASGLMMSKAKSISDGSLDAPDSANEVIQMYRDLSPLND